MSSFSRVKMIFAETKANSGGPGTAMQISQIVFTLDMDFEIAIGRENGGLMFKK